MKANRSLPASLRLVLFLLFAAGTAPAQTERPSTTPGEERTVRYFESIRNNYPLLAAFLREMPKGADLHNHLSGAIYAESFLRWAADSKLCIDPVTLSAELCDSTGFVPAADVLQNPVLYRSVVDAWSMRNWELSGQSGHDHFFDTFGKFGAAGWNRTSEMLAEALVRANRDRLSYLELMITPDGGRVSALGRRIGNLNGDFARLRERLLAAGLRDSIRLGSEALRAAEMTTRRTLGCDTLHSDLTGACAIPIRYLYQVGRGADTAQVFAQILAGFEIAEMNPQFVGFNLVQPEDYPVPLRDFNLHMAMIDYLRPLYKKAHVTLHAGELAPGLVPPEEMCCHIRNSIVVGHAERIGHGVDIAHEDGALELVRLMAARNVMVEICLTSNDVILGISGDRHPLPLYRQFGVPVALATDDEGVSRGDMTTEYLKAATEHKLGYLDLKTMARTSLEHAFIEGKGVWSNFAKRVPVAELRGIIPGAKLPAGAGAYLEANPKARLQWELEEKFAAFEKAQW